MDKITIRLNHNDTENVVAIANALRSDRQPFINRSQALKFALATVAADPKRFVIEAANATER